LFFVFVVFWLFSTNKKKSLEEGAFFCVGNIPFFFTRHNQVQVVFIILRFKGGEELMTG
jgi:hypothetical protein